MLSGRGTCEEGAGGSSWSTLTDRERPKLKKALHKSKSNKTTASSHPEAARSKHRRQLIQEVTATWTGITELAMLQKCSTENSTATSSKMSRDQPPPHFADTDRSGSVGVGLPQENEPRLGDPMCRCRKRAYVGRIDERGDGPQEMGFHTASGGTQRGQML